MQAGATAKEATLGVWTLRQFNKREYSLQSRPRMLKRTPGKLSLRLMYSWIILSTYLLLRCEIRIGIFLEIVETILIWLKKLKQWIRYSKFQEIPNFAQFLLMKLQLLTIIVMQYLVGSHAVIYISCMMPGRNHLVYSCSEYIWKSSSHERF